MLQNIFCFSGLLGELVPSPLCSSGVNQAFAASSGKLNRENILTNKPLVSLNEKKPNNLPDMNHEAYQICVCVNTNKQNIYAGAACEQAGRENYSRFALTPIPPLMLPALAIQVFSRPVLGSSGRDEDLSERNEDAYRIPDPCIVCGEVHLPPGMRLACPASRP